MRARLGIAGLSAKKRSSGKAGVAPSSVRALSPRNRTQSGSPTGATAAKPSSAPRRTMTRKRGSRPSAKATRGRCAQANNTPDASSNSRREGAWKMLRIGLSPLEFRGHEQQRERLRPAFGAPDGLPRFGRRQRSECGVEHRVRFTPIVADEPADLVGDIEALRQTIDPRRAFVRETLRRGRTPQWLAEQILRIHAAPDILDLQPARAHRSDRPFARPFQLGAGRAPRL